MYIKRPSPGHKKFRILEPLNGKTYTKRSPELEGINQAYLAGRLTIEEAFIRVRDLRNSMKNEAKREARSASLNELYIDNFWQNSPKGESKPRKNERATATARSAYFELCKLLPRTNIEVASIKEIQLALKPIPKGKQRRIIIRINTLWTWSGKSKKDLIPLPALNYTLVKTGFLSLAEVFAVAERLPFPLNLFCLAAFGTGGRPGEVYALTKDDLRKNGTHVWFDKTWNQKFEETPTKNYKKGIAYVIPECRESLNKWLEVPMDLKQKWWKNSAHAEQFSRASNGKRSYILRHSYAYHMLKLHKGASLTDLRTWMRSDMVTIEKHYLPWIETSEDMEANLRKFG